MDGGVTVNGDALSFHSHENALKLDMKLAYSVNMLNTI